MPTHQHQAGVTYILMLSPNCQKTCLFQPHFCYFTCISALWSLSVEKIQKNFRKKVGNNIVPVLNLLFMEKRGKNPEDENEWKESYLAKNIYKIAKAHPVKKPP